MLEDLPNEEKVRRGHLIRHTHPGSLDDALLALINDSDEVVAAAAIDLVRSAGLWTLAADVEHVLAHRDARDWLVFEAASWTLAERHLSPEERQSRWLERLPAIVLADRVRALSMFESVTIGFALLILPVSLGATGIVILASGALWASAAGRILDSSLRYTVDKTTREILFLPLPAEVKHDAKAFVDVTVDRLPKRDWPSCCWS